MKKNGGIELLRIVLMLMIVIGHLFCHTGIRVEYDVFTVEWIFMWGTQAITVAAVNCFVLLTGYFMVESKIKVRKPALLWGKVLFFSVTIFLVLTLAEVSVFTWSGLLDAIFPVLRGEYWFFTCYLLLYLLIPFLNAGLQQMSQKTLRYTIFVLLTFFYILPVFSAVFYQHDPQEGMSILGFISLYIIGAGIRKLRVELKTSLCIRGLLANNIIVFLSKVALEIVVGRLGLQFGTALFYHYNTIFQVVNAALLLLLFRNIRIRERVEPVVGKLAEVTFSVYLVHEHPLVRQLLWKTGLNDLLHAAGAWKFIAVCILIPFGVYAGAAVFDQIRKALLALFRRMRLGTSLIRKADSFFEKIERLVV